MYTDVVCRLVFFHRFGFGCSTSMQVDDMTPLQPDEDACSSFSSEYSTSARMTSVVRFLFLPALGWFSITRKTGGAP